MISDPVPVDHSSNCDECNLNYHPPDELLQAYHGFPLCQEMYEQTVVFPFPFFTVLGIICCS
jgi:hypothetical protein